MARLQLLATRAQAQMLAAALPAGSSTSAPLAQLEWQRAHQNLARSSQGQDRNQPYGGCRAGKPVHAYMRQRKGWAASCAGQGNAWQLRISTEVGTRLSSTLPSSAWPGQPASCLGPALPRQLPEVCAPPRPQRASPQGSPAGQATRKLGASGGGTSSLHCCQSLLHTPGGTPVPSDSVSGSSSGGTFDSTVWICWGQATTYGWHPASSSLWTPCTPAAHVAVGRHAQATSGRCAGAHGKHASASWRRCWQSSELAEGLPACRGRAQQERQGAP